MADQKYETVSNVAYGEMAQQTSKKSPLFKNMVCAFLVGGSICTIGQLLFFLYQYWGNEKKDAYTLVSVTLVFLAALLTGLGVYHRIAKVGGAGTLVPITGFSNAVTSPALEFKTEGYVLGLGAKMFVIAGPVIVYGISASILYGALYYLFQVMGMLS